MWCGRDLRCRGGLFIWYDKRQSASSALGSHHISNVREKWLNGTPGWIQPCLSAVGGEPRTVAHRATTRAPALGFNLTHHPTRIVIGTSRLLVTVANCSMLIHVYVTSCWAAKEASLIEVVIFCPTHLPGDFWDRRTL